MPERIGLTAVLELDTFSRGVRTYLGSVDKMSSQTTSAASSISNQFVSIGKAVLKVSALAAGAGLAGLAVGLGAVVTTGLKFNNTMEQASAKINAFTKDADLTAKILEDVRQEAAKTPFEFDAMANAVSGLLPAAKQADVAIMDLLKDAEVLAASNPAEGLEGAAFALREAVSGDFTSVIERFNLPRTMINKLKEEGLPALEIIRQSMKAMGYDMDLVSALANTAEGRWSTLKDTFTNLAGTVTKPIFEALSKNLGDINTWLSANEPMLQSFADLIAGKISEAITFLASKTQELFTAFQVSGFTGLAQVLGIPPEVLEGITAAAEAIQGLFDTFTSGMEEGGAGGGFSALFAQLDIGGLLQGMADRVAEQTPIVLSRIITGISDFLTNNWPTIQATLAEWGNKFFTWVDETALPQAGESLGKILGAVATWATDPATQTTLSGIGNSLGQALVTGIGQFFENSDEIGAVITKIATGLIAGVAVATGALIAVGASIVAGILDGILTSLGVDLQPATIGELGGILTQIGSDISTIASELGKRIVASIKAGWDSSWLTISGLGDKFIKIWTDAKTEIEGVIEGLSNFVGDILEPLEEGLNAVTEAIKTATGYFNSLAEAVASFTIPEVLQYHSPPPLAQAFTDIGSAANVATNAVTNFLAGMGGAQASEAMATAKSILDSFQFESIFGRELGGSQAAAAKDALKDVYFSSIGAILSGNLGEEQFVSQVIQRIGGLIGSDVNTVKRMLGSRVDDLFGALREQLGNASGQLTQQLVGMAQNFAGIGSFFANIIKGNIEASQQARQEAEKLKADNVKLTEQFKDQKEKLTDLQKELYELTHAQDKDTEAIKNKREELAELTAEMEKNRLAIAANRRELAASQRELQIQALRTFDPFATGNQLQQGNLAMIQLLQDFLAGTGESFELLGDQLGIDFTTTAFNDEVVWDRVTAQRELNRLLREQAAQQEAIAKAEEAQRQLQFLQQQISLLEMIRQLGVNPQDILGGITLGLGASASDLLAATNNIVQAMVNQINEDLQIGSPSRLMTKLFSSVPAGAIKALEQGKSLISKATQSMLGGSLMQPVLSQPVMAGAMGGGSTTLNLGGVHIGAVNNGTDIRNLEERIARTVTEKLRRH